jgi:hypothetical protein
LTEELLTSRYFESCLGSEAASPAFHLTAKILTTAVDKGRTHVNTVKRWILRQSGLKVAACSGEMSGLEVAGVVLGTIPLVITALEQYESSLGRWRVFRHYEGYLKHTQRELRMEHVWFDQCLRFMLTDSITNSTRAIDLETMISSPRSEQWKCMELHQALSDEFGRAYTDIFLVLVDRIHEQVAQLQAILPTAEPSVSRSCRNGRVKG